MLAAGDTWAVVESTSHGLAQQRVAGVAYDVAVLTNVTSEHLEFHGTLEAYRAAKQGLFARLAVSAENPDKGWGKHAVVNADDPQGRGRGRHRRAVGADVLRYGRAYQPSASDRRPRTWLRATSPTALPACASRSGRRAGRAASSYGWPVASTSTTPSRPWASPMALGLDCQGSAAAVAGLEAVPGRMQRIDEGQPFSVIVDYAHTAEALGKVLDELRPADPSAGLIAVFGSAGERDTAEARGDGSGGRSSAAGWSSSPTRIREARTAWPSSRPSPRGAEAVGRRRGEDLLVIPERAEAIAEAIRRAGPGDVVLLAGKGHESTIETADGDIPWDEAGAAREALRAQARRLGQRRPARGQRRLPRTALTMPSMGTSMLRAGDRYQLP